MSTFAIAYMARPLGLLGVESGLDTSAYTPMASITSLCLLVGIFYFVALVIYVGIHSVDSHKRWQVLASKIASSNIVSRTIFSSSIVSSSDVVCLSGPHETAQRLSELIETDGAGSWPPRASHYKTWPVTLRPYHEIYLELASLLPAADAFLDDSVNAERRHRYRTLMQARFRERIDLGDVQKLLAQVDAGTQDMLPPDALNGFYACVAMSRHAFRWATIPVVKIAQAEKLVQLPAELNVPWQFLTRRFGTSSPSGNITSNFLCNFDGDGRLIYEINFGMPALVRSAEYHFAHIFVELERMAVPIYHDMVQSIISFEANDHASCIQHLKTVNTQLRLPLKVFYDNMVDSRIPRSVWLSHLQGFQGWAAGETINGKYVEYDGLSGNQALFFRVLDAFLGMESYLDNESVLRYLPLTQRKFCQAIAEHNFRTKSKEVEHVEIEKEMQKLVKQLKVFRAAHMVRVLPYLDVPAPERYPMTAGKSVLEGPAQVSGKTNIESLKQMLVMRLEETV